MLLQTWKSKLLSTLQQRNAYLCLAVALLFLSIIQSFTIYALTGHWRVIVTPPHVSHSFWVDESQVSPSYLSEMTAFFATLILNVTSENAAFQRDEVLKYTDPNGYGHLKTQLIQNEEKIQAESITTAFYPVDIQTNPKKLTTTITGDLMTWVGQEMTSTVRQSYLAQYTYHDGRLLIQSFSEVKPHES
jgi:conjugal transfer pilus assembly protein TraE